MWVKEGHSMNEKMTPDGEPIIPVTEDEADDIRVTLETDDGDIVCKILTIFTIDEKDYIALLPLEDPNDDVLNGDVFIYRHFEDEQGLPSLENIETEEEYSLAWAALERVME